jgi:glyoxylase-like metal-dependent hydrolase (beta-lactamase superfamily II)
MRFATAPLATALALLALQGLAGAQNFDKIEIKTFSAGNGVYLLTGAGGNIGVLAGPDGVALIDSQFGPLHQKIKAAIAGVGGGPVRCLLNTNWHYDHALVGESGAVIVAREKCRPRMSKARFHEVIDAKTPAYSPAAWPEVTFGNSPALHLNGEEIEAVHIVGRTRTPMRSIDSARRMSCTRRTCFFWRGNRTSTSATAGV